MSDSITPAQKDQKSLSFNTKGSFGFDAVAIWNLKTSESFFNSPAANTLSKQAKASIYASMIFNLYVYIEGNLNRGLKVMHLGTPKNATLRKHISDLTRRNVHPFDVLKMLDLEFNTSILAGIKNKYQESFRFHEEIRNLVAHGGTIHTEGYHEWSETESVSIVQPDEELSKLIGFLKKKNVYAEDEAGPGYITSLATKQIYDYFKGNIGNFVSDLITGKGGNFAKAILNSFDFEFFSLEHPGPSSY